jgi:ferredoxin-NADP reductase
MSVDFHPLRVLEVSPLTDDSVAVTFDVPDELADRFRYSPGQHVTLRAVIGGEDVRRSYSICSNANGGKLRVGIKRLPGGAFSSFATADLAAGDVLEATTPSGEFTVDPDPTAARHRVAIVAGSSPLSPPPWRPSGARPGPCCWATGPRAASCSSRSWKA